MIQTTASQLKRPPLRACKNSPEKLH